MERELGIALEDDGGRGMNRIRRAERGQFVIIAALIIAMIVLATILSISALNTSRQQFRYKPVKESVLSLTSDAHRALTRGMAEGSVEYNASFWQPSFSDNQTAQQEAETNAEAAARRFISYWHRAALTVQAPEGAQIVVPPPDTAINWLSEYGLSFAEGDFEANLTSYGFAGWKSSLVRSNAIIVRSDSITARNLSTPMEEGKRAWVRNDTYLEVPFYTVSYVGYAEYAPIAGLDLADVKMGLLNATLTQRWANVAFINGSWTDSFYNGTWFNATLIESEAGNSTLILAELLALEYKGAGEYRLTAGFLNLSRPELFQGSRTILNRTVTDNATVAESMEVIINGSTVTVTNATSILIANVTVAVHRFDGRLTVQDPEDFILVGAMWQGRVESQLAPRRWVFSALPNIIVPLPLWYPTPPGFLITPSSHGQPSAITLPSPYQLQGDLALGVGVKTVIYFEKQPPNSRVDWITVTVGYMDPEGESYLIAEATGMGEAALTYFEDRVLPLKPPFREGDLIPIGSTVYVTVSFQFNAETAPGTLKIQTNPKTGEASYIDFDP